MNPNPDRSKGCLPPKKRESRQGLSDQQAPEDAFKPPAPLQSQRHYSTIDGHRENADLQPPPLPMLPPLSLSLPWSLSYATSMHHSYLPFQVGERRGMVSSFWRDAVCEQEMDGGPDHPISHHSRWIHSDILPLNLQPFLSLPTFKSVYMGESREMWAYSHGQQDYSSSFFYPPLFPQPTLYPHDSFPDSGLRYQGRQPNGVDGPDSRSGLSTRAPFGNDYMNNSITRLDGFYANGRKQGDTAAQTTWKGLKPQESTSTHSSQQNREPQGAPKAPMPTLSAKTKKAIASQDHYSGSASQTEAQIYYALGSLCPSAQPNPQAHRQLPPSNPPSCPRKNFQPSLHSQQNNHGAETERDTSAGLYHSSVAVITGPDPPPFAVLPHFVKGSLIELASGHLKRVEELKVEDFLRSADTLPEFHLSTCTVLLISPGPTHGFNHLQVLLTDRNTQELLTVLTEYPFFVRDHGWSSCSPQRSAQLYGLQCRQLSTGDVCLALTPTPTSLHSATLAHFSSQAQCLLSHLEAGAVTCTNTADRMPPTPAPPPFPVAQPSTPGPQRERPRTHKRRWSAPELHSGSKTCSHLPQGSKHKRQ